MTVHDHPERVKATARGDLAQRLIPVATELAVLVRDEGREAVGEFLAALTRRERDALLVVLAAMVPVDDVTPAGLLSWVTWDEFGQQLDGATAAPQRRTADEDEQDERRAQRHRKSQLPARRASYAELRAQGLSIYEAAERLQVHPRTAWRYERDLRQQQDGEQRAAAEGRSDAA